MKYKITTRGWVVFSVMGIIGLFGLYNLGFYLFGSEDIVNELPVTIEENETNDESSSNNEGIEDSKSDVDSSMTENSDQNESDESLKNEEESTETSSEDKDSTEKIPDTDDEVALEILEVDMEKSDVVLFNKNIAELEESYVDVLEDWVDFLNRYESIEITIEGHINGYPYYEDGDYGLSISLNRANVIAEYMINKGVNPSRITILNMGSKEQIDKSDDTSKHFLNRRAIIYINKKESK